MAASNVSGDARQLLIERSLAVRSMVSNPYEPPTAALDVIESSGEDRFHVVGKTVVAWEKLRLIYNTVMGLFVLAVVVFSQAIAARNFAELFAQVIAGGIFANLCYCVGPIIDGYLTWFGFRHRLVTIVLFIGGTIVTMLLALVVIAFPVLF